MKSFREIGIVRRDATTCRALEWAFWSAPQAKAAFVGSAVYWGVDRAANTAVSISVWEEHPDEIPAYTALVREFRPRAQEYIDCSPTVDTYEVVKQP